MCDALLELAQNTYMNWLLDRKQSAEELDIFSKPVANVPVRRIVPHADSECIGELCELITKDPERLSGRQARAVVNSER